MHNSEFLGKKVLITGATKGVGLALAQSFLSQGAKVYGVAREASDIPIHPDFTFLKADLSEPAQITAFCDLIDKVDIIVNNAGITFSKKIEDVSLEEWQKVLSVNLTAPFLIIKSLRSKMSAGSSIVNVSSIAGRNKSLVAGVHYTSSKAGIIGLTRQLAQEFGPFNIRVNCVCPSQTLTPMLKNAMSESDMERLSASIPLRRLANVQDVVEPILFLASSKSAYLNGSIIDINGGQL